MTFDEIQKKMDEIEEFQRYTLRMIELTAEGQHRVAVWNAQLERTQSVHAQIMAEMDDKLHAHAEAIVAIDDKLNSFAEQHRQAMAEVDRRMAGHAEAIAEIDTKLNALISIMDGFISRKQ
jgi:hypothetical protein